MGVITEPTPIMWDLVDAYEQEFPSAVFSGINGDAAHQTSPGKHLSRSQNKDKFGSDCWPLQALNDQKGPTDKAVAVDISMSRADQNRCHNNLIKVYNNRKTDPRAKWIYAFNGWNGEGSPWRYNVHTGANGETDDSHKWHEHQEGFYAFVNDPEFVRASHSAFRGETIAQYNSGGTMTISPEDLAAIGKACWAFVPSNREGRTAHTVVLTETWRWSKNADNYLWRMAGMVDPIPGILGNNDQPSEVPNLLARKLLEMDQKIDLIAAKVDIDQSELDAIKQAAHEGAQAGAADADAIATAVVEQLNHLGLTDEQTADVKAAVSDVLLHGAAPVTE